MTHIRYFDITELNLQDRQRLYDAADSERKKRADRCLKQEDSDRCIVAGALLRYAVGGAEEQVERTPQGKPYLKDRPDFHFNLTHSGRWVAVAWGARPVGLDVEVFRANAETGKLARRFFCPDEQACLNEHPDRFFKLWTMKESYLKYLGTGLTRALNSFSVLEPEALGVSFVSYELEDAFLTLCTQTPAVEIRPLTLDEIQDIPT